MHEIEPHYNWRNFYQAEEDPRSPFFNKEYSEIYFSHQIYNHVIHPQWDDFGSPSLYMKLLYTNYEHAFCVIELMGEWNDCINNDIMHFKRNIIEHLHGYGIENFVIIGENILDFHAGDLDYYEEWQDEIEGFIYLVNLRFHVQDEMDRYGVSDYFLNGGKFNQVNWRTHHPLRLFDALNQGNLLK